MPKVVRYMLKKTGIAGCYFRTPTELGKVHSVTATCKATDREIEFVISYRKVTFVPTSTLTVTYQRRSMLFLPLIGIADTSLGFMVEFSSWEVSSIVDVAVTCLGAKMIQGYRDWRKAYYSDASIHRNGSS